MTLATTQPRPPIFDRMAALADGLRSRILLALDGRELTVSELCTVLQVPQSTVSRHLKTLAEASWVESRPDGTRRLYQFDPERIDATAGQLWRLTRQQVEQTPAAGEDGRRLETVLALRRDRSREFFADGADRWELLRDEMFGNRFYLLALLGLLDPESTVADLGCGSGPVSEALAPVVGRVVAVDGSPAMLRAARQRLGRFGNVDLRCGELESLPIDDGAVDAATLILVLHHVAEPARVLAEAARVLRPGGRLVLVDMLPHERTELQRETGHVWLGFREEQIARWLAAAGLRQGRFVTLPPEAAAKGPTLFAATAQRAEREPQTTLSSNDTERRSRR